MHPKCSICGYTYPNDVRCNACLRHNNLPAPVLSKRDMYARFMRGEFGNTYPHYATVADAIAGVGGYHAATQRAWNLRDMIPGGRFFRDVPYRDMVELVPTYRDGCMIIPTVFDIEEYRTLNGECTILDSGLYVYSSTAPGYMRESLAAGGVGHTGSAAKAVLDVYLNENSRDDMRELLTRYPDHVIEFTCYSKCFGTLPHRNTVIWEVRKY